MRRRRAPRCRQMSPDVKAIIKWMERNKQYADDGDTDYKISSRMNISPATFYNYKKLFPAFAAARQKRMLRQTALPVAVTGLGKCRITTETVRDGQTRKTVERLLPPNLTAIKYWLDNMADGCPAGYTGRMGETTKPQTLSKGGVIVQNEEMDFSMPC